MTAALREIEVFALDCQASGASPANGDLLEIGWARCGEAGLVGSVRSHWIMPRTRRPVRRAVRELTGWTEACVAEAIDERDAWTALRGDIEHATPTERLLTPTVIHFARFELPFLRDLHGRIDSGDFPFDVICLHAVASRLFPDLPRRNIRALAGYLGHSPELLRRAAGHVEATAFIWHAVVPILEGAGVTTWDGLKAWLDEPMPSVRRTRRTFPLAAERRRALPPGPGVYRFVRRNGDVLYVGKATSLRKRVAGHFKSRGRVTERGLELLTQVHDIVHTETATLLEAAILETDEIKRIDPPYNVALRSGERRAWFASRDFRSSISSPDVAHRVGPLPSPRALSPLAALIALLEGRERSPNLCAAALAVPAAFRPDEALFAEGWTIFHDEHLTGDEQPIRRLQNASLALWLERGRTEVESDTDESAPDLWDLARVRRRLERSLVQTGLLVRRARVLCLLTDATVAFREHGGVVTRCLVLSGGEIADRIELCDVRAVALLAPRRPPSCHDRQGLFDAAMYDRLRILLTEMNRIAGEQGEVALRVGMHTFDGERLERLFRAV
jgi:DNA polymerase-3 subunit epsilon